MTDDLKKTDPGADPDTLKLIANFLRQLAGTDWSGAELRALAAAVESGRRRVQFDPDFSECP